MDTPIYLDYNATTPVDPAVLDAMLPWFSDRFWNAASSHRLGRIASDAVEVARGQLAELLDCGPQELVFTAGATEANNLALKGTAAVAPPERNRLLVGATEHKAVGEPSAWLADQGWDVQIIPVDWRGRIDIAAYRDLLDPRVAMVSVMAANNETGVLTLTEEIIEAAHEHGALVHTDMTQVVGKLPVDLAKLHVDLASLSAHKLYGPKGVGALFVRRPVRIATILHGGKHERDLRSGTLNVPGIVGLGAAAELADRTLGCEADRQAVLVARLHATLRQRIEGVEWIGADAPRLSNTASIRFLGADAEAVIANLPDVLISTASACSSGTPTPSHVLIAMGLDASAAAECLRFSVGRPTSEPEIDAAAGRVAEAVERVRTLEERWDAR